MSSDLLALYARKKAMLWVEDLETRAYLREAWNDKDIGFLVAAGNESVFGAVRDAHKHGATNVLGMVDRDFRPSNRDRWLDSQRTFQVHVLEAVEIECYALDEVVLETLES